MNPQQISALIVMADRLLERARSYVEQADAGFGVADSFDEARLTTRRLKALLALPRGRAGSHRERYCELALNLLEQVQEIHAILTQAGCEAPALHEISASIRHSAAVVSAVRSTATHM